MVGWSKSREARASCILICINISSILDTVCAHLINIHFLLPQLDHMK